MFLITLPMFNKGGTILCLARCVESGEPEGRRTGEGQGGGIYLGNDTQFTQGGF